MPSLVNAIENLQQVSLRLDKVSVENLPYERCLELYDSKETFFFVDPPYLHAKPGAYKGWNDDQMTELRERLEGLRGRWLVTVNDAPLTRKLFKGCKSEVVHTRNGTVNSNVQAGATVGELIIEPR